MPTTYNIKPGSQGYDPRGVQEWGPVERLLTSLVNVTLGAQFQSSRGLMVHVLGPLKPGQRDFTVKLADIVIVPDDGGGEPTIHITHEILIYSDGSVDFDNVHYT